MQKKWGKIVMCVILLLSVTLTLQADRRSQIYRLGQDLERLAIDLALNSYEHFKGWDDTISDLEQGVLFKSSAFVASVQLFMKLTQEDSDYYGRGHARTNLYSSFQYLARSFNQLDRECRNADVRPYELQNVKRTLDRIEREFTQWPSAENLAYLDNKYVKARNATVYLIQKRSTGVFVRRAFRDLESLYKYNYDMNRGKDPWKFLVEVTEETLNKMENGRMLDQTFEGKLIIEMSTRPNRPVFRIENGKKRGITSPQVLERFGGWDYVYEVPIEVIRKYADGKPIK